MKKQILSEEFRRMQKLAGLITETLQKGDTVKIKNPDVNLGDEGKIIKVYTDYNSIPKGDIGYYELDIDAYEEEDLNEPWYKVKQGDVEQIYSTSDLNEYQEQSDEISITPEIKAFIDKVISDAKRDDEFEYLKDVDFFDNDLIDLIMDEFDDDGNYNDVSQEIKDYIANSIK
jgi:hypothetical protein